MSLLNERPEQFYVFLENNSDDLYSRWQSAANLTAPAAICTLDEPGRSHIVAQCKASQRPGAAADLAELVHQRQPSPETPLWMEQW